MEKTFEIHTYEIQDLIIALIERDKDGENPDRKERLDRWEAILTEMNAMCCMQNYYKLEMTVDDGLIRKADLKK